MKQLCLRNAIHSRSVHNRSGGLQIAVELLNRFEAGNSTIDVADGDNLHAHLLNRNRGPVSDFAEALNGNGRTFDVHALGA
ncbi:hypothetical protein GALL_432010 [mine drainage metagenome]|uniref:Uncharacterized protein n=1 Tax=mine drainage metagenome TaxID=410659 RepID=A0A1J5QGM9_9ZZZZ